MNPSNIPTLTAVEDATQLLQKLAESHEWVSVFWDRGWGDSGQVAEISIIVDGDGQEPKAWLTPEVYAALCESKVIPENTLKMFKARRAHDFKTPPPPEPKVNPADIAETVIRKVMQDMDDKPIRAEFFRGLDPHSRLPRVLYDHAATRTDPPGWHVLILPGASEVAISAQVSGPLGWDVVDKASILRYPRSGDDVDLDALTGEAFRAKLIAVIEDRLAAIAAPASEGEPS